MLGRGTRRVLRALAAALAAGFVPGAAAQFHSLDAPDLRLVYFHPFHTYLVPHAARCFENSMEFQKRLFHYTPWEPVTVLLTDFGDYGNAGASVVPANFLSVDIAPMNFVYETYPSNERLNTLMNHELVHIVASDQAARGDRRARAFFRGKVRENADHPETMLYTYLTSPRRAAPRWYHEGLAVFVETWMAGGLGRAQGSWDEMVFRSMVRDGAPFHDPLGLASEGTKNDFQLEANSYLYGTRFMTYLAHEHSPESLIRWVSRTDGTKAYYAGQFERVYGMKLDDAWADWVRFEGAFQRRNLEAIRQFPITPHRDLAETAMGSVSRAFFDPRRRRIYAAFNYPGVVAHVGAIAVDDGVVTRLVEVKGPAVYSVTSLAYDPAGDVLFYTADNYSQRDLHAFDVATGEDRRLIRDARIGDLALHPVDRSLWGVRHFNGFATVVRIPPPYASWEQVVTLPYGELIYDLDISPDGRLLSASVGQVDGHHALHVFEIERLRASERVAVAAADFGTTIPSNFVFTPDGRALVGSSYYTGVSNLFRFDLTTKQLEALTNTESGLFRPIPVSDDRVYAFRFTGQGFVPAEVEVEPLEDVSAITFLGERVVARHPVLETWKVGSPADVPLDEMTARQGEFAPIRALRLESVIPVVEGYKDAAAVGVSAQFADPLSLNRARATVSYSPDGDLPSKERIHGELKFERHDWRAGFRYNDADFYDLFGPTKQSRKGYALTSGYSKILIYDEPRQLDLDVDVAFWGGLDRLPYAQNVEATFDRLANLFGQLAYRNLRASLGAVDYEKGWASNVLAGFNYVDGELIPALRGTYDVGIPLPLKHSSIWLRTGAGVAFGQADNVFANFYFGGFGNNWVDHGEIKRYREVSSFPGFEIDELGGRNFARAMVEWNLPPLRFRRVGTAGFYLSWARASLFTSALATNLSDDALRRETGTVGGQIDLRMTAVSRLDLTLSLGFAVGKERGGASSDEAMVSLKILR